uniref:CCAAT-binding factor domain-containing protein n=1 Tax=Percolomonas cosmopolitus TaxID=63605 RepID=A0A7S1KW16_9EUKA
MISSLRPSREAPFKSSQPGDDHSTERMHQVSTTVGAPSSPSQQKNNDANDDASQMKKQQNNYGAYRNHSFDDFQRAMDSRKLLATNPVFWYNKMRKESAQLGSTEEKNVPYKTMMTLFERSLQLVKKVVHNPKTNDNYVEPSLIKELLERGTLADQLKIRSSQLIENPLGSLEHLDALILLFESRRHVDKVLYVIRDLFLNYLMPYRKLVQFKDRPLKSIAGRVQAMEKKFKKGAKSGTQYVPSVDEQRVDATLMFWYFEDTLKKRYNHFLELIDRFISDPYIPELQVLAVRVLRELVCLVPESRSIGMSILVRSLINPSVQKYSHSLMLQMLDSTAFWFCPHLSRSEVVKELLRQLYNSLQLPPVKAVLRIMVITSTLKHIPLFQKDIEVQDVLLDGYLHTITTLRLMGRSRSFLDEGNPIYSGGMKNCMRGLERLLSQALPNRKKFLDILTVILSLGEVRFLDTQLAILRLMYRTKVAFGELPENVDKYLYRRLFNVTMYTGFHAINTTKALSDLLFSVITNDSDEPRAAALFKRMLQSAFAQSSVFTGYMFRASFNILTERPLLWRFITEPEVNRKEEGNDKTYQLHGGNPSYMNAERSAFWELVALHTHTNPSIRKYCENFTEENLPNVHHISFEALHYNEILRSLLEQGQSTRVSKSMAFRETREPGLTKLIKESAKDHLGFEEKFATLSNKKKKIKLSREESSAVDEVLYGADDGDDDEERHLMELERDVMPSVDELNELMEDEMTAPAPEDEDVELRYIYADDANARPETNRPHGRERNSRPDRNYRSHPAPQRGNREHRNAPRQENRLSGFKRKERHPNGRNGQFSKRRKTQE